MALRSVLGVAMPARGYASGRRPPEASLHRLLLGEVSESTPEARDFTDASLSAAMMEGRDKRLVVAITDRREIEFDMQAVRLVIEWSPRAAQAFGLPPLHPASVRGK